MLNMYSKHLGRLIVIGGWVLVTSNVFGEPQASVIQTQNKLQQVGDKIHLLRRTLTSANDRRHALNKELAQTEKQIGNAIHKRRAIQNDVRNTQQKIDELQQRDDTLNKQLVINQQLLAAHIRARYQMGEYQPLKWVLDQDKPYELSRLLSYYQYLIKARQQLITQITTTRKQINGNKKTLSHELIINQQLQQQLNVEQEQLEQHKGYHSALIESLDNEIETQEQNLVDFEKDQYNLSQLLTALAQKSAALNTIPFAQMSKKLPEPVRMTQRKVQKMNQGVTFFAEEGSAVTSIYGGKVVFSDWLKGYGLLLIIDHGQEFMSLYAHNQSLFKHQGETVQQNEQIASVGHSGGLKQNGLYFELRLRGKAISPFDWLA